MFRDAWVFTLQAHVAYLARCEALILFSASLGNLYRDKQDEISRCGFMGFLVDSTEGKAHQAMLSDETHALTEVVISSHA